MCPRVRLPGHVVASGRLVRRSPTIEGGYNRSIDLSMLASRHGGQCLRWLGSRLCLISDAAVLRCCCPRITHGTDGTGSVSACSAWLVYFECSRVATKCGLSSHDFFPRDIIPPVIPVSLRNQIFLMWRVNFTTSQKVRVFSKSFEDFYSFLLRPDCTFEGLRRNRRFVSVLFEVSDIRQHVSINTMRRRLAEMKVQYRPTRHKPLVQCTFFGRSVLLSMGSHKRWLVSRWWTFPPANC